MFKAESTCHYTVKSCHGLPLGEDCIGQVSYSTELEQKSECDKVDEITGRCESLGEAICRAQENKSIEGWQSQTKVHDITCEKWQDTYDLEFSTC